MPSLAKKVNVPLMPEGGRGPGVSNDWCINTCFTSEKGLECRNCACYFCTSYGKFLETFSRVIICNLSDLHIYKV